MKKELLKLINLVIVITLLIVNLSSTKINAFVNMDLFKESIMQNKGIFIINNLNKKYENESEECKQINDIELGLALKSDNKCINKPKTGKEIKEVKVNTEMNFIEEAKGVVVVETNDKLFFIDGKSILKKGNKCRALKKTIINEVAIECSYKKGQMLDVISSNENYIKIKTDNGFNGWINKKNTYSDKGIVYVSKDSDVYWTAEFTPMNEIRTLKQGEEFEIIDERKGYYLIWCDGKMAWISIEDVNNKDNITLKIKNNIKIYEAPVNYLYKKGEKVIVIDGSYLNVLKVRTSNGQIGWVNREDLLYDNNKELVAKKEIKVYYTGNKKGNVVRKEGESLANTASNEVGYREGNNNETKYGEWYGMNSEWCAIFVSWCANASGINQNIIPKHSYCMDGVEWFMKNKCFYNKDQYMPKKGDIAYFNEGGGINHIGIVSEVTNDSIITIEGNMSDSVLRVKHKMNDNKIAGYGSPIYDK